MAFPYFAPEIYDNGLNRFGTNCTMVVALVAEAFSYADATTVSGTGTGKMLASAILSSSDFAVGPGTAPAFRQCVFGGKTGSGVAAGDPIAFAFLDVGLGRILTTVAETGTASVASGATVVFPSLTFAFATVTSL